MQRPADPSGACLSARPLPAGNTATGWLKLIAMVFMMIDHLGAALFPGVTQLRILGRAAFPIYCWCMVVGFHYTRSVPRYLLRILIVGVISQPIYARALNHIPANATSFWTQLVGTRVNIFLTLFLGLLGLWSLREKKYFSQFWGPVAVVALATVLQADYGWKGVLFIMLLYACRTSRPAIAAVMISFFLFWGSSFGISLLVPLRLFSTEGLREAVTSQAGSVRLSEIISRIFPVASISDFPSWLSQPMSAFFRLETWGLLSLPFLLIRFRKNLKMPTWLGYALYPLHLLLIMLIKAVFPAS